MYSSSIADAIFSCYKLEMDELQLLQHVYFLNLLLLMVLVGMAPGIFKGTFYFAQIM